VARTIERVEVRSPITVRERLERRIEVRPSAADARPSVPLVQIGSVDVYVAAPPARSAATPAAAATAPPQPAAPATPAVPTAERLSRYAPVFGLAQG